MRTSLRHRLTGLAAAFALLAPAQMAVAMSVQPVVVDLQAAGRPMSAIVTVENTFQTPLPVEVSAQIAEFVDGELRGTGKDAEDLVIFPPQAVIAPGRSQAFRVQWVGDPGIEKSRHFIITVAQTPVKLPEGQTAVQVLYSFQVVTSVAVAGARPQIKVDAAEITTEGDGQPRPVLTLSNASNTYGYLAAGTLRIIQKDAGGKEIYNKVLTGDQIQQEIGFGLVGAGQTRRLLTPLVLPQAGGKLDVEFTPGRR